MSTRWLYCGFYLFPDTGLVQSLKLSHQLRHFKSCTFSPVVSHLTWRCSGCELWTRSRPSQIQPPPPVAPAWRTCSCLCRRWWCPLPDLHSAATPPSGGRPHPSPLWPAAGPRATGSSPRWPKSSAYLCSAAADETWPTHSGFWTSYSIETHATHYVDTYLSGSVRTWIQSERISSSLSQRCWTWLRSGICVPECETRHRPRVDLNDRKWIWSLLHIVNGWTYSILSNITILNFLGFCITWSWSLTWS